MDLLFYLLIDFFIDSLWRSEEPKIDVRLLSHFPNQENKLSIEIENICNVLIELESVAIVLKSNGTDKLFHQDLIFTKEQLILPPFSPQKITLTGFYEKNKVGLIKYFEFKLAGKRRNRMKVTPINLFLSE